MVTTAPAARRPAEQDRCRSRRPTCRPYPRRPRIRSQPRLRRPSSSWGMSCARRTCSAPWARGPPPRRPATGCEHRCRARYRLFSSYHCSRLNTNTGRLTPEMFEAVFASVKQFLETRGQCALGRRPPMGSKFAASGRSKCLKSITRSHDRNDPDRAAKQQGASASSSSPFCWTPWRSAWSRPCCRGW